MRTSWAKTAHKWCRRIVCQPQPDNCWTPRP